MNNSQTRLTIRDYPTVLWIVGIVVTILGLFMHFYSRMPWWMLLAGPGLGFILLLLSSVLTITVDKSTGFLTLEYRSLLRRSKKEIGLHELQAIQVDQKVSHDNDGTSTTYQVVAITKDGVMTPFRAYYSSGWRSKQKIVEQLRAFTGIGGTNPGLGGLFEMASQLALGDFQKQQGSPTGPQSEERVTDGVRWQIQTVAFGSAPVTRWFSSSCQTEAGFLYLAQISKGQKMPASGVLASLNSAMLRASMAVYGLGETEAPGLRNAAPLDLTTLDTRLADNYIAYTDNPSIARQILNPWVNRPLSGWADQRPLTQVQAGYGQQLVVLFSTNGVSLGMLGAATPEQLDELTTLGVEIIRAQGTPAA